MIEAATLASETTADGFLGGLVTLVQPRGGHRAGLDAALLQAIVPADGSGHAIDLGAGVGTVAFSVAARASGMSIIAVERDRELLHCARAALALPQNAAFAARITLVHADVALSRAAREQAGLPDQSADWVLMNPPYDVAGRVRPSTDLRRRDAHIGAPDLLQSWFQTAAALLKPGGLLGVIHRAAALPAILAALGSRFGDIRIVPVHAFADKPAIRLLVRARRASRAGLQLLPPLVLHKYGGAWSERADAILRGRGDLTL